MTIRTFDRLSYIYKLCIIIALLITAAILIRDIIIPLAFAAFLAILLLPLVKRLERKTGLTWAVIIILVISVIIFGLLTWLLINQIVNLANDLPNLESKFYKFVDDINNTLSSQFGIEDQQRKQMAADLTKSVSGYVGAFVGSILLSTTNTLSTLVQIPIYLFLLLIYREKFKHFFLSLLPNDNQELTWKKDIENVIQGYISGLLLVTLIITSLNTIGLLVLGIDYAIFFGVLSGVLTIIPYVGIFIGALFPVLMALITKDSLWYALGVIIVFTVVQFLEGNFITPRITGSKVSINALAAIIALLIGGKILGIAGMILAVPAIGIIKILLSYSTHLKPFMILLGDDNPTENKQDPTEQTPPIIELKKGIAVKEEKSDSSG